MAISQSQTPSALLLASMEIRKSNRKYGDDADEEGEESSDDEIAWVCGIWRPSLLAFGIVHEMEKLVSSYP